MKRKATHRKHGLISLVIPAFNEEDSIPALYSELSPVLKSLPYTFEIIFVDDGSTDATLQTLKSLSASDKRIKVISLSRNFGHQAALTAGMDHARGKCVITMDGDLQHPPSLLPSLIGRWEEGSEVVITIRKETKDDPFLKKRLSHLFYRVINDLSRTRIHPSAADFRLLDRKVLSGLSSIRERDRFLRGLISWIGFKTTTVTYEADARYAGKTKYTWRTMIRFALDGIVSFSAAPLHLVFYTGLVVSFLSFLYALYSLYGYFFTSRMVPGWTSLLLTVLFLGGVQLVSIGILGEYLIRVYDESKGRPIYIISEITDGGTTHSPGQS